MALVAFFVVFMCAYVLYHTLRDVSGEQKKYREEKRARKEEEARQRIQTEKIEKEVDKENHEDRDKTG